MGAIRSIRDWLNGHSLLINIATAVLGIYLAVGNVLRGAKVPSEHFWAPWRVWFVALLVAAVYVPLYALYKGVDAYFEAQDRRRAEAVTRSTAIDRDLLVLAQQVVAELADQCVKVSLTEVAAQIWLCCSDDTFDRRIRFFLPHLRKTSGVEWRRGKGVAGVAWAANKDLVADLTPLHQQLARLGSVKFDAQPVDKRYGMTHAELDATDAYTGIVVRRLFSTDPPLTLQALFIVDYMGHGELGCIAQAMRSWRVNALLGACEKLLTEAGYGQLTTNTDESKLSA